MTVGQGEGHTCCVLGRLGAHHLCLHRAGCLFRAEGCAPSCRQGVQPSGRHQQDAWLLQQPNVVQTKAMDGIVCLANGLERQRVCMGSDNTSHGLQFLQPRSSMAATHGQQLTCTCAGSV